MFLFENQAHNNQRFVLVVPISSYPILDLVLPTMTCPKVVKTPAHRQITCMKVTFTTVNIS